MSFWAPLVVILSEAKNLEKKGGTTDHEQAKFVSYWNTDYYKNRLFVVPTFLRGPRTRLFYIMLCVNELQKVDIRGP